MKPEHYDFFSSDKVRIPREQGLLTEVAEESPAGVHGVLDVSCGTGIHAYFYAGLGYRVTARDVSEDSLARAAAYKSHTLITYEVGDMRDSKDGQFGLALVTGNSLSAMASADDLQRTFHALAGQLAPGGKVFIQTLDYAAFRRDEKRTMVKTGEIGGVPVIVAKAMVYAAGDFVVSFTTLERDPEKGWTSACHTTRLNPWFPDEIRAAARAAELTVEAEYSSYAKEPFAEGAGVDYLVVLRR